MTEVKCRWESKKKIFLICKVKQDIYFQNRVTCLQEILSSQVENIWKRGESPLLHKVSSMRSSSSESSPDWPYSESHCCPSQTEGCFLGSLRWQLCWPQLTIVPTVVLPSQQCPYCWSLNSQCYRAVFSRSYSSFMCWFHLEIEAPPFLFPHILEAAWSVSQHNSRIWEKWGKNCQEWKELRGQWVLE